MNMSSSTLINVLILCIEILVVRTAISTNQSPSIKDACVTTKEYECTYLYHNFSSHGTFGLANVHIYCYKGERQTVWKLWKKPHIRIANPDLDYHLYWGPNATDVHSKYLSDLTPAGWDVYRKLKGDEFSMEPFNYSCLGIWSNGGSYTLYFTVKNVELWFVLYQALGIFLYFSARKLSKNTAFHYSTGMAIGVVGSALILAYVIGRFIPKKTGLSVMLLGGSSVMFYLIYFVITQLEMIIRSYYHIVAAYLILVGLISFAVCYKYGPVTDLRSLNLIRWSIQLIGFVFVYCGSQIPEVSAAIIIVMLAIYNFPNFIIEYFRRIKYRVFPPTRRMLTEEEYLREGDEETRNALDKLRTFCKSPDCNAWRTISHLDSPSRFARFVEGNSHIDDEEILIYDHEPDPHLPFDLTDDSDDEINFQLTS